MPVWKTEILHLAPRDVTPQPSEPAYLMKSHFCDYIVLSGTISLTRGERAYVNGPHLIT